MTVPFSSSVSVYTRGRDPIQLLKYEASRRPGLMEKMERAHELTDEEVAALDLPLPWMRNAFSQLRERAREAHARGLQKPVWDVALSDFVVDSKVPDPVGVLYEYCGATCFVPSGGSEIEVPTGKLFFVCGTQCWIEAARCRPSYAFMDQSRSLGPSTRTEYNAALQERLQRLYPDAPKTVCAGAEEAVGGAARQPLAHLGVTIQR